MFVSYNYFIGWDQHGSLIPHLSSQCKDTDQPSAALVKDLEQRGLLKDTLIVWGGEFGRTAYSQGALKSGEIITGDALAYGWQEVE